MKYFVFFILIGFTEESKKLLHQVYDAMELQYECTSSKVPTRLCSREGKRKKWMYHRVPRKRWRWFDQVLLGWTCQEINAMTCFVFRSRCGRICPSPYWAALGSQQIRPWHLRVSITLTGDSNGKKFACIIISSEDFTFVPRCVWAKAQTKPHGGLVDRNGWVG